MLLGSVNYGGYVILVDQGWLSLGGSNISLFEVSIHEKFSGERVHRFAEGTIAGAIEHAVLYIHDYQGGEGNDSALLVDGVHNVETEFQFIKETLEELDQNRPSET